jgi:hypothetical protein
VAAWSFLQEQAGGSDRADAEPRTEATGTATTTTRPTHGTTWDGEALEQQNSEHQKQAGNQQKQIQHKHYHVYDFYGIGLFLACK